MTFLQLHSAWAWPWQLNFEADSLVKYTTVQMKLNNLTYDMFINERLF